MQSIRVQVVEAAKGAEMETEVEAMVMGVVETVETETEAERAAGEAATD
jgi:hypothetical protein